MVAALALTSLAACGDDKKGSGGGDEKKEFANSVSISGVDYGYVLDKQSVKAGRTRIEFKNDGKDMHMLAMAQVKAGKTFDDAKKALESEDEADDATVFEDTEGPDGAPQILTAGEKTATFPELKAGTYALVCFFQTPDGKPHFIAGMLNQLTVESAAAEAQEVDTTAEATLADGKITLPDLSSGKATLKVSNTGAKSHDLTLVRVPEGKTFDEVLAWVDKYFQGQGKIAEAPGAFPGGMSVIPAGATGYLELDLSPGKYYAICTESADEQSDAPSEHFRNGGEKVEFTVT